jgi:putative endonuclease
VTTYIALCADGTYYTGVANNTARRIRQHNGEIAGGAKYTRPRRPVRIVFEREFPTPTDAKREEARIKRLTRPEKEALINGRSSTSNSA